GRCGSRRGHAGDAAAAIVRQRSAVAPDAEAVVSRRIGLWRTLQLTLLPSRFDDVVARRIPHDETAQEGRTQAQPSGNARVRNAEKYKRTPALEVGGTASAQESQLLDYYREAGRISTHHGGLGPLAGRSFPVQHGQSVAQGPESCRKSALCGLHRKGGRSGRGRGRCRNRRGSGPPCVSQE